MVWLDWGCPTEIGKVALGGKVLLKSWRSTYLWPQHLRLACLVSGVETHLSYSGMEGSLVGRISLNYCTKHKHQGCCNKRATTTSFNVVTQLANLANIPVCTAKAGFGGFGGLCQAVASGYLPMQLEWLVYMPTCCGGWQARGDWWLLHQSCLVVDGDCLPMHKPMLSVGYTSV